MIIREQKRIDDLEIPGFEVELQADIERTDHGINDVNFNLEQLDPERENYELERDEYLQKRKDHADKKEEFRLKNIDVNNLNIETQAIKHKYWKEAENLDKEKAVLKSECEVQTKKESEIEHDLLNKNLQIDQIKEKVKKQKTEKNEF
jgi:hypothetical protein